MSVRPEQQTIGQGEEVTLTCSASGDPRPSVIWTNGQGILPSYCHAQEEETSYCKIPISDDSTVVMICLEPLGP